MARPNAALFVLSWGAGSLLLHLSTALSTAGSTVVAAILALAVSRAAAPRALNSAFARTVGSMQTAPASRDRPSSPRARTAGPHAVSAALPERRQRRSSRRREDGTDSDSSSLPEETT